MPRVHRCRAGSTVVSPHYTARPGESGCRAAAGDRVGRAPRVLKSIFLTLACASSADAEDVQRRRVHARWSHGGEAWDGARCPPRWRPLAGPCALERARARVAGALDGCAARLTAHACVHPGRCVPGKQPWVATRSRVGRTAPAHPP